MGVIHDILEEIGDGLVMTGRALKSIPALPRYFNQLMTCSYEIGYTTLPIVAVLSLFIGGVLALQAGYSLSDMPGANEYLGSIVGLSMCRELGPVMTAFLLAGRVGSAITAELASMTVYSEIDALKTMNIPPERFLVMPRIVAAAFMMPTLTIVSIVIGWFGGMLVAENIDFIHVDAMIYWRTLKDFVDTDSLSDGLIKAEVFGLVVSIVACNVGLRTRGGPREIGSAVTHSVVTAMVLILLLDYFVTRVLIEF